MVVNALVVIVVAGVTTRVAVADVTTLHVPVTITLKIPASVAAMFDIVKLADVAVGMFTLFFCH